MSTNENDFHLHSLIPEAGATITGTTRSTAQAYPESCGCNVALAARFIIPSQRSGNGLDPFILFKSNILELKKHKSKLRKLIVLKRKNKSEYEIKFQPWV